LADIAADVTYEATGSLEAIHGAVRATRDGGRVVVVGSARGTTRGLDIATLADRGITLIGAHIDTLPVQADGTRLDVRTAGEQFLDLVARRALDLHSLVSIEVDPRDTGVFYRHVLDDDQHWVGALLRWDALEPPFRPRGGHWLVPPLRDGLHGRRMLGGATHRPQGPSPTQLLRQERRVGARARTRLGVAVFRSEPPTFRAKRLVDHGVLGDFVGAHLMHHIEQPLSSPTHRDSWHASSNLSGGGVLAMNGIHYLDWLLWLTGVDVTEVHAYQQTNGAGVDVENGASLLLAFENGAIATVNVSSCVRGLYGEKLTELRIWGR